MNQRGKVVAVPDGKPGAINLQMSGSLLGIPQPVTRPLVGNAVAGFHFQPNINDQIITLNEMRGWSTGSTSVADPALMSTMLGGESQILHADGRMAYWQNGTGGSIGLTTLYSDLSGVTITVDHNQLVRINQQVGILEIDGTTIIPGDPFTGALNGLLSIGGDPFDGTSSGHFVGAAGGTVFAANVTSAYTGDMINLEQHGVSLLKVSVGGNVTAKGNMAVSGTLDVTGAATMHSTLDALGALTAHTTLNVTGATVLASTLDFAGHLTATGSAPGLSAVGAQFSGVAITGNDAAGTVSMTGSTTVNQYQFYSVATVTFASAYPVGYTPRVTLTGNTASFVCAVTSVSRTGFTINLTVICGTATTTFGACSINYQVISTH